MTTSSLQNINWLSKKVWAVYIKKKNVCSPSIISSPYNVFLHFLEGQVHKSSKLGITTNEGKNMLIKVISINIKKISDACANSFGRCIHDCTMYEKCFYFLLNWSFSGKMVFLRKLKLIYSSTPQHYKTVRPPSFLILFKKIVSPTPIS